jgi:hypothetical protein
MDRRGAAKDAAAPAAINGDLFKNPKAGCAFFESSESSREAILAHSRAGNARKPAHAATGSVRVASADYASIPPPAASAGIWFGSYCFSEPELLPCSVATTNSGLYAILVRDLTCYPRMMRVLYFGESGNISAHLTPWHEKYPSWCEVASGAIHLYVAFLPMESSTPEDRASILSSLIEQYQPECNTLPESQ